MYGLGCYLGMFERCVLPFTAGPRVGPVAVVSVAVWVAGHGLLAVWLPVQVPVAKVHIVHMYLKVATFQPELAKRCKTMSRIGTVYHPPFFTSSGGFACRSQATGCPRHELCGFLVWLWVSGICDLPIPRVPIRAMDWSSRVVGYGSRAFP